MKVYKVVAMVKLPMVPDYLIMEDGQKISIADIEIKELQQLGEEWAEALVERALQIRKDRTIK